MRPARPFFETRSAPGHFEFETPALESISSTYSRGKESIIGAQHLTNGEQICQIGHKF